MKQKLRVALLGLALFALILAGSLLFGSLSSKYKTPENTAASSQAVSSAAVSETSSAAASGTASADYMQAPDFTVYDASGKQVKLSDFRGKPVVLDFWASWCEKCTKELPYFQEEYQKEKGKVQFLFIDCTGLDEGEETQEAAMDFLKTQKYTFPVFYDLKQDAATQYSFADIPDTYFIDKNGRLIAICEGTIEKSGLERSIAAIK